MHKGHILGYDFGKPRTELLKPDESNDCPPGSQCAKDKIEIVRQRLHKPLPPSKRFAKQTGNGDG
jgi:hypothetical protein